MTLPRFAQSLGGCSLASLSHWGMLPRFAQLLGDAPSLRSVAGGMLPCFAQSLGECSLASLSRWGDAPSLRSVTGGTLPHFAQSLGGCSLASHSRFPFNGSIKLLQNLHSRRPTKQHFHVWEPRCLHKVKRANEAINMHSKGSNESLPKYRSPIWKNGLVPPCSILLGGI